MAKPRVKISAPRPNTNVNTDTVDTELEPQEFDTEDTSEGEGYTEDNTEDPADESPAQEDEDTEEDAGAHFEYPTMDDMEEDEEPAYDTEDTNAGVHFVGSTSRKDTPDQLVKVRLASKQMCIIGGERYDFIPNKVYLVPKNVRDVLAENDLLRPL